MLFDWSLAKGICRVSDLKSVQSSCNAKLQVVVFSGFFLAKDIVMQLSFTL